MDALNQLSFAVSDRIDDLEVGPKHVPLSLLGEFQKDVADFLKGSNRDIDANKIMVSIESGSLAFVATGLVAATTLWTDLNSLSASSSLDAIDQKRAGILTKWQESAKSNPNRQYRLKDAAGTVLLSVNSKSAFQSKEDAWVHVEKYLHGKVIDMGGKKKPNVHIELENGQTMTIAASHEQLAQSERNRLYRDEVLRITAEENLLTGELKDIRLIAFESYQPRYDEDEFQAMVERGTQAWSDVTDPTSWLESLRGGKA